jgi:uncharacterized integral membrane protein
MSGRVITLIVLVAIVLIYVGYNTQPIGVKFLFWETQISTALVTLGAFLAGIILGLIIAKIDQFTKQRKKKSRKKKQKTEGR